MSDTDGLFLVYDGDYHAGRKPTGELFIDKVPESTDRLAVARKRLEAAEQAWDECAEMDNSPIRGRIGAEAEEAKVELFRIEHERMYRKP